MGRNSKLAFTEGRLWKLRSKKKKRSSFYDSKCPGLEFRVSQTGYKAFYLIGPRGRRVRLGEFPTLSLEEARELASEKRLTVDQVDPLRKETLEVAWLKYREDMLDRNCRLATVRLFERCFRNLKAVETLRLQQISPGMVVDLQAKIKKTVGVGAANNTIKLLRATYNFAIRRGWSGRSPVKQIRTYNIPRRERFIEPDELPGFISTLEKSRDVFSDLILFALFTGARRTAAKHARWEDISLRGRKWSFIGKGNKKRRVYLCDYAFRILERRKEVGRAGAEYVFENPSTARPVTWVRRIMYQAEMVSRGLSAETPFMSISNEYSLHTLRHTFITYALQAGVSVQVVQAMVGHANDKRITIRVYGHSTEEWERDGFQRVEDFMLGLCWPKEVAA